MQSQNGKEYAQNYDVVVKWLANVLRGETLEILGVPSGRIEEVFGFEPVDIAVKAGRVDVMARDETGAIYHLEEQRNLTLADLYRFASYHFQAARQWGKQVTDVILASGEVYGGETVISTCSGRYAPIIVDFTQKNGPKRLAEIRAAVDAGTFTNWLELVFLPLYGEERGEARSRFAEEVLRFASKLFHAEKVSVRLLAATLILSNKLIDKEVLLQIWEEVKMLDILEIAREKGIEEGLQKGKTLGLQEGKALVINAMQEMVIETLIERFGPIPAVLSESIREIRNQDTLKGLFHHSLKCSNLQDFETSLQQVL
ncbi:MAG: hypothetical protein GY801_04095 [bacterium]|nr:hypothetical protein [bacterium]